MTQKCFLLLFSLLLTQSAQAIGLYRAGDKLYVQAPEGVVLYKTADLKADRLDTLVYADTVRVLAEDFKKKTLSVEMFKGYSLKGYWIKVKSAAGLEGFVYDGYFSTCKAPMLDPTAVPNANNTLAEAYLLTMSKAKGGKIPLNETDHRMIFENGAQAEFHRAQGSTTYQIMFQRNISIEEGFLIGKELWLKGVTFTGAYDQATGKVSLKSSDGKRSLEVSKPYGFTILKMVEQE